MATVEDNRHANLLSLIAEAGNQRALADRISEHKGRPFAPAQISQWAQRAPDSKTGKPRVIHSTSARMIEAAMGRPPGWMDQDHSAGSAAPVAADSNRGRADDLTDDEIRLLSTYRRMPDDAKGMVRTHVEQVDRLTSKSKPRK